jgi:hypothetical protein
MPHRENAAAVAKGVFEAVGQELVDDQADRLGALGRDLDLRDLGLELYIGGGFALETEQAAGDRHQILAEVDQIGAAAALELLVDRGQRADPLRDLIQIIARLDVGDAAELQIDQAHQLLIVVTHPMSHLAQQCGLLFGEREVELDQPRLVDRERQDGGVTLQELDVVLREHARLAAVGLEHAEDMLLALDDDVDRALDAMLAQQLGDPEALLPVQVVGDHRLAGLQGIARGRGQVGADPRLADHALAPADSGANQKRLFLGQVLEHFDEPDLEAARRLLGGVVEQPVEIRALGSPLAEIGELGPLLQEASLKLVCGHDRLPRGVSCARSLTSRPPKLGTCDPDDQPKRDLSPGCRRVSPLTWRSGRRPRR